MNIPLTLAINPYDHVRDLLSGEVRAAGIDLVPLELPIEEIFYRFTKFREWQASEMSFGKVISLMSEERPEIICIPVFLSRVFRHSAIYLKDGSSIKTPKDLEGKRVGIPEWAQTAGIYVRGMLAHEYGVDLAKIQWIQAGVREPGRVEKVRLNLAKGVTITPRPDRTLVDLLQKGDLDAVMSAREVPGTRLFGDYRAAEVDYWKKTRIFPVMHVLALRRDVYERNRWLAMNLFQAFLEARRRSMARVSEFGLSHLPLPWVPDHVRQWREIAGEDFWPYGIEPNRPTLEAFLQYGYEQGVCKRRIKVEDLFAPETLQSFKI
jgi:4,5-dihydroxyphthalate decarboxylase